MLLQCCSTKGLVRRRGRHAALQNGSASVLYDKWAAQSYFVRTPNASCLHCPNFVPIGTARDYDFRLRHLHMRGVLTPINVPLHLDTHLTVIASKTYSPPQVRGVLNAALEDDYTESSDEHHYAQPNAVKSRFDRSELFVIDASAAAKAAGGLDVCTTSLLLSLSLSRTHSVSPVACR